MEKREGAPARAPARARVGAARTATPVQSVQGDVEVAVANRPLDPRDAGTLARLQQRTATGGYAVSDADLVRAIRAWKARGDEDAVRRLSELLVTRCMPEFQRRSYGLRHRPDLMEEAIAGMIEQLLREARNPREEFMLMNFIHYLRCLCADNFQRVLRQEGLSYKRDALGHPVGRGMHVPQALIDRLDVPTTDAEGESQARDIAERTDTLGSSMAALEAQRILRYLTDPLDRKIVVLRVFEEMRWDDIAAACGKTERTMRLRFEKARKIMRDALAADAEAV